MNFLSKMAFSLVWYQNLVTICDTGNKFGNKSMSQSVETSRIKSTQILSTAKFNN